jgi:pimeloyl-ACP methyl ester carboxylesterase
VSAATVVLPGGAVELVDLPAADGRDPAAPIVALHEGLGSVGLWRGFPEALAAATGRRTVAYSRVGHGRSAVSRRPHAPGYMHDEALVELPELLERRQLDRPILVGHSDGASIALIHAGSGGAAVTAVVAIAPHVFVEDRAVQAIRAARERYETTDLSARMARHHNDADATFRRWNDVWLSNAFRSWNIEGGLAGVDVPVLGVQAADDEYGTLEQLDRIEAAVTGPFQRLVLPDGGHSPHLAHPVEVVDAVARFCEPLG